MEELVHHISPYFIEAHNLGQVEHINKVFGQHSHKAGKHEHLAWKSNVCYTIAAADRNHRAVESWFVGFLSCALDVRCNISGNDWSSLLSILNHLRYWAGFTFRNEEDVISDNINVLVVNTFQMFISNNTLAAFLFNIKGAYDFGAFNAGSPDNSLSFDNVLLAEGNTAFAYFGNLGASDDFYFQLPQMRFGLLDQLIRQNWQNLRSHIGNNQTNFRRIDIELSAQFIALFSHFTNELDTGKAGTNDHEGQHCTAYSRIFFLGRFGVHIADLTFQRYRVVIGPEGEGILFSSRNSEEGRFASCADNQVIISISSFI
ncbi:hypothetical protein D3C75_808260 [compost metagenome]